MAAPAPDAAASGAAVSLSARKVYEQARSQLVQVRTVLKGQASQTSVGSGFFVSPQGHLITNFHVVAQAALKPERHDLVYSTADGRTAPLHILMIDVRHDLALLKAAPASPPRFDTLSFRPGTQALAQGERMYSLGNPLDVGFAVIEGNYNGLVERSFYPQIFFAGSLSAGMSGGPALDQEGRVIGVNVARRGDGEQVSFLVPAQFARELLERGRNAPARPGNWWPLLGEQLQAHQQELSDRFIAQGWKPATHPRYAVPVPRDGFMRCWGSSDTLHQGALALERSDCVMDTRVFVGDFSTGALATRHESYEGKDLGALRFSALYARSFRNEDFARLSTAQHTGLRCHQDFVRKDELTLRAVVCLRAYKKLPQLYDVSVLVATLDQSTAGVQGRFDAQGLSYANAMKLTRHYLEAYGWARSR